MTAAVAARMSEAEPNGQRRRLTDEYLTRREAETLIEAGRLREAAAKAAHESIHAAELTALETAMGVAERDRHAHDIAHDREHAHHTEKHGADREAIKVAMSAVDREREIHADAHGREHMAHAGEHSLNNLAITKAEKATDDRFASHNAYREQINELVRRMVTRDQLDVMVKEHDRRYEEQRSAIINLEKGDVKGQGRALGQGSIVAYIVTAVGLVGGLLGILIIVSNFATRAPS